MYANRLSVGSHDRYTLRVSPDSDEIMPEETETKAQEVPENETVTGEEGGDDEVRSLEIGQT